MGKERGNKSMLSRIRVGIYLVGHEKEKWVKRASLENEVVLA